MPVTDQLRLGGTQDRYRFSISQADDSKEKEFCKYTLNRNINISALKIY